MPNTCHLLPVDLAIPPALEAGVEHRRVFDVRDCRLSIYETFHPCPDVVLSSPGLVVSSMMRGRKQLEEDGGPRFDFVPGESVIIPAGVSMKVEFPEADVHHPVQCATLAMDRAVVDRNLDFLNEHYPNSAEPYTWRLDFSHYHFPNNRELAASINRLISVSMEDDPAKDALADLSLKFLLLRIIQTQNLRVLEQPLGLSEHRFAPVVEHVRKYLHRAIEVDELARVAGMSRSVFFRAFKAYSGSSPLEFVLQERIQRAKQLLADPSLSVSEAGYRTGFNNMNYFIRQFKRIEGLTPKAFKAV